MRHGRSNEERNASLLAGDDTRAVGTFLVHRTRILGTRCYVFAVYEPGATYFGTHGTTLTIGGKLCGSVMTRALPANIAALSGDRRVVACDYHRATLAIQCANAIHETFPDIRSGDFTVRPGEVEVWL
jgi:hypothetical protein